MRTFALIALALVLVPSASAVESTIVPGVGIGKLKLGMTVAQAERLLGKDHLVNDSGTVGDKHFVDYGWNFSSWSATFIQEGKTRQLAQVATTLRSQKTPGRIGVGSSFKAVARAYPAALCGSYHSTFGPTSSPDDSTAIVFTTKGRQTAFLVHPSDRNAINPRSVPWVVYEVLVRSLVQGNANLVGHCAAGWRQRGTP